MQKTIRYKGATVSYEVRIKKGRSTVILLHGFLESKEIWNDYIKKICQKYNVIALDLLGHGMTSCLSYVHTMEEMADQVRFVMKTHDVRKGILVGHSMGGYVALAFTEKYPDNIKGLCLFNSSAFADTELKKKERDRAILVVKKYHDRFIKEVIPNLFVSTSTPQLRGALKRLLGIALKTPKQGIIAALEGMKIRDNREIVLKFAPCPVFYVIGKKDKLLPYEQLIEQCEHHEHGTYYLSEEGGHLCFFEDKYPTLTALMNWLGKLH